MRCEEGGEQTDMRGRSTMRSWEGREEKAAGLEVEVEDGRDSRLALSLCRTMDVAAMPLRTVPLAAKLTRMAAGPRASRRRDDMVCLWEENGVR